MTIGESVFAGCLLLRGRVEDVVLDWQKRKRVIQEENSLLDPFNFCLSVPVSGGVPVTCGLPASESEDDPNLVITLHAVIKKGLI